MLAFLVRPANLKPVISTESVNQNITLAKVRRWIKITYSIIHNTARSIEMSLIASAVSVIPPCSGVNTVLCDIEMQMNYCI